MWTSFCSCSVCSKPQIPQIKGFLTLLRFDKSNKLKLLRQWQVAQSPAQIGLNLTFICG